MTWGKVQQILLCMNTNIDEVRRQAPTWNPDMPLVQWDTVNHRYVDQKETFIDYYSSQLVSDEVVATHGRQRGPNKDTDINTMEEPIGMSVHRSKSP